MKYMVLKYILNVLHPPLVKTEGQFEFLVPYKYIIFWIRNFDTLTTYFQGIKFDLAIDIKV